MKKILFIINPISGGHNKTGIIKAIPKLLDTTQFDIYITHTKYAGHATEIAQKAVKNSMDIVVAVGGDGTINEIASQLVNTPVILAIVPCGSGNGLARDLAIPLHYEKAIKIINTLNIKPIDVGICNQQTFFSLAGMGYDARVAFDFNLSKKRKFLGYTWAVVKGYFNSKEQLYEIELDDEPIAGNFFFITVANCSQWGYNVKVAPNAQLADGLFDIVLCKRPSIFVIIPFGMKILFGKIANSNYISVKRARKILVKSDDNFIYHLDGDAKGATRQIEVDILHKQLNMVVPKV
jgi:YegS/Rv2252/BmrU family lipid kinase